MFARSAMTDKPKREKPMKEKSTILKTDDEIMDEVFGPEVLRKLKDLAHEKRPKANNED
jgi:hypothetical protein